MRYSLAVSLALMGTLAFGQEFKLGAKVSDFSVQDLTGKSISFSALKGPVTVVTFIATECPVSNAYNERMKALYNDYAPKGVKFVFVNANSSEPASEVRDHAKSKGFPFAVYKDAGNVVADRFGAEVTPESYVVDSSGIMRYHGQIDDSRNESHIKKRTLSMALDAMLASKPVPVQETKAFGCTIKRVRKTT